MLEALYTQLCILMCVENDRNNEIQFCENVLKSAPKVPNMIYSTLAYLIKQWNLYISVLNQDDDL